MNYDRYTNIKFDENYHMFLFLSKGPKGTLPKLIVYSPLKDLEDGYNLGFGTIKINPDGKEYLDGDEISDNGDRDKILATIAYTVFTFISNYPDKKVYLSGSDKIRTRLYQMAINHAFEELSEKLLIFGDVSDQPDVFDLQLFERGVNYTGFVVQKK